jgi:dipeptidase E
MRLFLSSQDFGNYPEALIELIGDNTKTAFINNAKDDYSVEDRTEKTEAKKHILHQVGLEVHELDLRSYFGSPKKLQTDLSDFGLVWTAGGNSFILRRAMKASGLDKVLKKRLADDSIVYGGFSAGACVTAPSLHGIEYGDRPQPDVVPSNYPIKETVWEGLGLVKFMVVPHYKSDWFGEEADKSIEYFKQHKIPYRPLKDGQVIVIEGDNEEFLK